MFAPQVLAVDISGIPRKWITPNDAIHYYASDKVAWDFGEDLLVYRGGINSSTGLRSILTTKAVVATTGSEAPVKRFHREVLPHRENSLLFRRDRNICAYCGDRFVYSNLTRDHILPQSRGGKDDWTNVVSACKVCNNKKDNRTPEEAGMELLYVPYTPCRWEQFILMGKNVRVDQMDYLAAKLPKHSRFYSSN